MYILSFVLPHSSPFISIAGFNFFLQYSSTFISDCFFDNVFVVAFKFFYCRFPVPFSDFYCRIQSLFRKINFNTLFQTYTEYIENTLNKHIQLSCDFSCFLQSHFPDFLRFHTDHGRKANCSYIIALLNFSYFDDSSL